MHFHFIIYLRFVFFKTTEQSGNDFQRTIDRILMNKWYNVTESKQRQHELVSQHLNHQLAMEGSDCLTESADQTGSSGHMLHYNHLAASECTGSMQLDYLDDSLPYQAYCGTATYPATNAAGNESDWRSRRIHADCSSTSYLPDCYNTSIVSPDTSSTSNGSYRVCNQLCD